MLSMLENCLYVLLLFILSLFRSVSCPHLVEIVTKLGQAEKAVCNKLDKAKKI